jgi:hypothetical protein
MGWHPRYKNLGMEELVHIFVEMNFALINKDTLDS